MTSYHFFDGFNDRSRLGLFSGGSDVVDVSEVSALD